jgi:hypothetical protein
MTMYIAVAVVAISLSVCRDAQWLWLRSCMKMQVAETREGRGYITRRGSVPCVSSGRRSLYHKT